jgi:hypothetical protein
MSKVGALLLMKQDNAMDIKNSQASFEQDWKHKVHTGIHTNSTCSLCILNALN